MMELGATLCTARDPRCGDCPITRSCVARRTGSVAELPRIAKRRSATPVHMAAGIVRRRGRALVLRLSADAPRWAGLWVFPSAEVSRRETPERAARRAVLEQTGIVTSPRGLVRVVKFTVTRFRITLDAFSCTRGTGSARPQRGNEAAWMGLEELESVAMPKAHRAVARALRYG